MSDYSLTKYLTAINYSKEKLLDTDDREWERKYPPFIINKGLSYFIAPKGSIISFSTSPGAVADDGNDVNSPYTLALADSIKKNNISIEQSLKLTSRIVLEKTDNVQQPWYSSSLSVDFYLRH